MKKLLNSMLAIVEGKEKKSPKINLISAHDLNVAGALHALNLWNKAVPPYSSAVIFELYERHSLHFVRVSSSFQYLAYKHELSQRIDIQ